MSEFSRWAVLLIVQAALGAGMAQASLQYERGQVVDPASGLVWERFDTIDDGLAQGYVAATDDQLAALFVHYVAPDETVPISGYEPTYGRVSFTLDAQGRSFDVSWGASYYGDVVEPPSLLTLGASFSFGDGLVIPITSVLVTQVISNGAFIPVRLKSTRSMNQYGSGWGSEIGALDFDPYTVPLDSGYALECEVWGCPLGDNPYLTEAGEPRLSGFLMVTAVPEPPAQFMLTLGCVVLALGRRLHRRAP